jgi:hypothetical protein
MIVLYRKAMMDMLAKRAGGGGPVPVGGGRAVEGESKEGPEEKDKVLIQLKDHPAYAKYFKMLKGSILTEMVLSIPHNYWYFIRYEY